MALQDIAEGIEVVESQEPREVTVLEGASDSLEDRVSSAEAELPCSSGTAATLARWYGGGASVGRAAEAAAVPPTVATKVLHLLGFEAVVDVDPADRAVVRSWVHGDVDRTEAERRCDLDERAFALAVFVETRDPVLEGCVVVDLIPSDRHEWVGGQRALRETMSDPADLQGVDRGPAASDW